jgi:hypothetical protein
MPKPSALEGLHAFHDIPSHLRSSGWLRCKRLLRVFEEAASEWNRDNGPRLSAALAFYILLSLAPVLVVFIAVLAIVYGKEAARGQLVGKIQGLAGHSAAAAIQEVVKSARQPGAGTVATLLGLLTVALGASSVVVEFARCAEHNLARSPGLWPQRSRSRHAAANQTILFIHDDGRRRRAAPGFSRPGCMDGSDGEILGLIPPDS